MLEDEIKHNIARPELLQIAESVAREKSIDQEIVIEAMEEAIESAAKRKYGQELEIKAGINRKNGEIDIARVLKVSEIVGNKATEITLEEGKKRDVDARIGDYFYDPLPTIELGRVAAQTAKQVIIQKVRDAEREKQYEEFKDRVGEVVNGLVKRIEYGNVIVDLGRGEAFIRRDDVIPRETFRPGDRIRSYISEVKKEQRGPQIYLSRTSNEFISKLFTQEVPEIYDGIIQIMSVARDPGSRAKISVSSKDNSIDPVGACVGMRGSRVQAVVAEEQNEKIDIIPFSEDVPTCLVNALAPAEVTKVVLDEVIAQVLVTEGFTSVEAVAYVPIDDLIEIEGFDQKVAEELRERALVSLKEADESLKKEIVKLNISEDLTKFEGLNTAMLVKLGNAGIKNINDLADLASDELKEILDGIDIPNKDADEIIMRARAGWFEEDSESNKKEDTEVK